MNSPNRKEYQDFEEKKSHIEHKKAALNKQKKDSHKKFVEYGFDDEYEMKDYEKFIK